MSITLSFNSRVSVRGSDAAAGLRDGIRLFERAEELGLDAGWVYQRHFDNYLSSPLTFLAAAGQYTERLRLGTAIIPIRNEDPLLLAEAAGTADLLVGERLELGIGKGQGGYDHLFGDRVRGEERARADRNLDSFLTAVRGERVGVVEDSGGGVPAGTELRVRPHSPGLAGRIWYGAGSLETTTRTAERGLRLLLGTIVHAAGSGLRYDEYQRRQIDAYRADWTALHGPAAAQGLPRVAVARSVLPATSAQLHDRYEQYDLDRQRFGPAASRPEGALPIGGAAPAGLTVTPVLRGTPDEVIDLLRADAAVQAADELIVFLPPEFGLAENSRLLEDIVRHVGPALGWAPAQALARAV